MDSVLFNMKQKIITHSGSFHADDVFAVATLSLLLGEESIEIIRTRDKSIFETGDFVVDVGRVYDEEKNRFDHHQEGWNIKRENGVPYASFGLVWKVYGEKVCGNKEIVKEIDGYLVSAIDAHDNGLSVSKNIIEGVSEYSLGETITLFNKNFDEESDNDQNFLFAVSLARKILKRIIDNALSGQKVRKMFREVYEKTEDKRYVVFDIDSTEWKKDSSLYPELLFVVHPYKDSWALKTIKKAEGNFENRKSLPLSWAGKEGEELQKITGVSDALFCHNKLFIATTKTKESAFQLLKLALM